MGSPGKETRVAPNIYQTPHGWRVYVKRDGVLKPVRFKRDVTLEQLEIFVRTFKEESERLRQQRQTEADAHAGTFAADVARYLALKTVQAMPSYSDRARQIAFWRKAFGRRPRSAITTRDVDEQLQALFDGGASGSYVNKHRTALMALYTRLDGRAAANPVREARLYEEAEETPRGRSYALLKRILDAVPADRSRPVKGQKGSGTRGSLSRVRLELMAWTGMAPSQVGRLEPGKHFDLAQGWYVFPRRDKGKKPRFPRPVIRKQMTADARAAFRRFVKLKAAGPFDRRALRHTWLRALKRVQAAMRKELRDPDYILERVRLYDIRHSFGTEIFKRTKDLAITAEMLDHSSLRTTRRYSLGAMSDVLKGATRKFEAATGRRRKAR
jgi:site-specific recombinase XerD